MLQMKFTHMHKLARNAELLSFLDVVQDVASMVAIAACPDIQVSINIEAFEQ